MRKRNILFYTLLSLILLSGFVLGRYVFPKKKIIPISERKDACEAKGGRYNFNDSLFHDYYYERCDIINDEIKDF